MTRFPPIVDLLPHKPPMVLLDDVAAYNDDGITVALNIRSGIPFFTDNGVPAHVGLEYMAQTCGVYAGLKSREAAEPIRMGFLLGTRNFMAQADWFAPGSNLKIHVKEVLRQESLGVFDCRIDIAGQPVASAQLTVYQSDIVAGGA